MLDDTAFNWSDSRTSSEPHRHAAPGVSRNIRHGIGVDLGLNVGSLDRVRNQSGASGLEDPQQVPRCRPLLEALVRGIRPEQVKLKGSDEVVPNGRQVGECLERHREIGCGTGLPS
jgi:hypothetical protein